MKRRSRRHWQSAWWRRRHHTWWTCRRHDGLRSRIRDRRISHPWIRKTGTCRARTGRDRWRCDRWCQGRRRGSTWHRHARTRWKLWGLELHQADGMPVVILRAILVHGARSSNRHQPCSRSFNTLSCRLCGSWVRCRGLLRYQRAVGQGDSSTAQGDRKECGSNENCVTCSHVIPSRDGLTLAAWQSSRQRSSAFA